MTEETTEKFGVVALEADGSIQSTSRAFTELGKHICPTPLHAVDSLIYAAASLCAHTLALGKEGDESCAEIRAKMQGLVAEVFDQVLAGVKSRDDYEELATRYLEGCERINAEKRRSLN